MLQSNGIELQTCVNSLSLLIVSPGEGAREGEKGDIWVCAKNERGLTLGKMNRINV
jgi:hypothetical protein